MRVPQCSNAIKPSLRVQRESTQLMHMVPHIRESGRCEGADYFFRECNL